MKGIILYCKSNSHLSDSKSVTKETHLYTLNILLQEGNKCNEGTHRTTKLSDPRGADLWGMFKRYINYYKRGKEDVHWSYSTNI